MAEVCRIDWSPAAGRVLSGEYTLSRGITPSIITLTCIPFTGQIPAISDVTFVCGGTSLRFKDCGYSSKAVSRSGGGTVWTIQLLDARWRWRYGILVGHYNELINHGWLSVTSQGEVPADEAELTKSARDLAKYLMEQMDVQDFDVDALPATDFPEVVWDHIRPAQALADLCDTYGLVVCFDPVTGRVEIAEPGDGDDLPNDATVLSDDVADAEKLKPKTIKAVCDRTAHEEEFELEAVGLDTDGKVKALADLSYCPAGGWGSDYLLMSGVADDSVADPNDPSKTTTKRKIAEECVYRWYRIKKQDNWRITGWAKDNSPVVTLAKLLPINAEVLAPYTYVQDDKVVAKKQGASVRGVHASDWKAMGETNSAATATVAETFTVDEDLGVVKFSQPVFKWNSGAVAEPTLYLRCIVRGDRYIAKQKDIGGPSGVEAVDCSHLVLKYKNGAVQNKGDVDAKAEAILDAVARGYEARDTGSRTYIGIKDLKLDGKRPQVTWSIGPSGATTQASQESEHNPWIASEAQRRLMELQALPEYAGEGVSGSAKLAARERDFDSDTTRSPRAMPASNNYGSEIPAYSLVLPSAAANDLLTVSRPNADSLANVMATGQAKIATSGKGLCSYDWPLWVKYAGSAPAAGDERGTAANSFELTASKKGFKVMAVDATRGLALIVPFAAGSAGAGGTAPYEWAGISIDGLCYAAEGSPTSNYNGTGCVGRVYNNGVRASLDQITYMHLASPLTNWLAVQGLNLLMDISRVYCRWSANAAGTETLTLGIWPITADFDVTTLTWNTKPALSGVAAKNYITFVLTCAAANYFVGGAGRLYSAHGNSGNHLWYAGGDEVSAYDPPIYGFGITADWSYAGTRAYNEYAQNIGVGIGSGLAFGKP